MLTNKGLVTYNPSMSMRDNFHVTSAYSSLLRELGLDAETFFTHPDIRIWRSITERENATLDAVRGDGSAIRLHIKRYRAVTGKKSPAEMEAEGIRLLQQAGIPTVPLVGHGRLADGRSVIVSEDLAGYQAADKAVSEGLQIQQLTPGLAEMVGKLHRAGLHHRDLYLCHFFVNAGLELRLIDAGRVKKLPGKLTAWRWVVKDLAQLLHSMREIGISDAVFWDYLEKYGVKKGMRSTFWLGIFVRMKAGRIARHDRNLRADQPMRNVSIPK
ncbi:MAG TPA: lipopolysaccharide kinase InaA family protein [Tepidisphaeraceae bacterium]|nr:lipopolysaccharide kinase InaA family protein [Tepidisphaeraceae bacterium]